MLSIYYDEAATTPIDPAVRYTIDEAMYKYWNNPSSTYSDSIKVKTILDKSRELIKSSINADKSEQIYFTSGGSEGNNMIIQGFLKKHPNANIITSMLEHKSIIECCKAVCKNLRFVPIDKNGKIKISAIKDLLENKSNNEPTLVIVQLVNNETGVIQPISAISRIIKKYDAYLFTDAVQAFPHIKINVNELNVDFLSVSGHKFGCPKGIGFVYIRWKDIIKPLIYGSQEQGLRGGTENIPEIIGMAEAIKRLSYNNNPEITNVFKEELENLGCTINGIDTINSIISCTLPEGNYGETIVNMFDILYHIMISTGSACNSNSGKPSYVLEAMGLSNDEILRTIRISCKNFNENGVRYFLKCLKGILANDLNAPILLDNNTRTLRKDNKEVR